MVLVELGWIVTDDDAIQGSSAQSKAAGLHNFFICIEMFFAAVGHSYAFAYDEFANNTRERKPLLDNLMQVLDVHDVVSSSM